jgi:Arc/MetJ-type ribon-helix-helix transcriptional regulator
MSNKSIDLPEQLQLQVRDLVEQGWFGSEEQVVQEAVRRFLEAHRPELMARFIREDVEWGLQGDE